MITELILIFIFTSLLFFLVSLFTKKKFIWVVVPLNIVFLITLFFSYVQFIGTPLPFQYKIPFWKFQTFTAKSIVLVKAIYVDDDLIHLIVADPKGGHFRYVTIKNTPEFLIEWNLAWAERSRDGVIMNVDTDYPDGTGSSFPVNGLQMNENNQEKAIHDNQEGIENYHSDDNDKVPPHIVN